MAVILVTFVCFMMLFGHTKYLPETVILQLVSYVMMQMSFVDAYTELSYHWGSFSYQYYV